MKRLLRVFGVLALAFALTAVFSVPESAYASGTKAKPKVDGEVHYYDKKDESGAVTGKGIDYFTLNPYTYHNICKDSGKLTKNQIRTIAEKEIFPRWGVIAEGMFRDQASQLVTIEGSGMMSSDKNASESFDRHFSYGKKGVNTGYSGYNWSVSDLADMLGHDKTSGKSSTDDLSDFKIIKGSTNNDEVVSCGIHPINNLNDARTMMGRSLRACADDNDLSVDDFLGNGKDKSGNEYRLPALADDKTGGGYVNIVTCNNRAGDSGDYDYVAFGIAVYDFDVTPIAARGLNYITEADEYIDEDNPIKVAAEHAKPNSEISYNENGSGSVTSLMENKSPQEATTTTTLENSATEENFISTEDEFEWGMEQEIGVEVQWGGDDNIGFAPSKVAFHANQGWHESWRTMTSKGETKSKTTSKSVSTEMPLPGHTGAVVVQNTECKEWTLPYGQPVALNYKVAVFAMSGDYYNGWGGMISASRYDKEWMSVIFDGSDGTEPGGSNALASLHSRAVTNVDETSYDGVKGKYRTWCDKGAWKESKKIDWNKVAEELTDANETRDTHKLLNVKGEKSTLKDLASEIPMAELAANLNDKSTAITSTIQEFLALYPLDSVAIEKGNKTYDMVNGDRMYLDGIELQGYDADNVDFFGFDQGWGQWELQGDDVVTSEDSSGNEIQTITKDGGTLKLTTFKSGSQRIDASNFDSITSDLTFNLKWTLDKDSYSKVRWNKHTNGITEDEAEAIETPTISVNVSSATKDVKSIAVSGEYEGPYDESVNLSKELDVEVKDSSDTNISVPVFWEDNTTDGNRYISENGDTKFPTPGNYKVRAYTMKNAQKIISGWITVKAKEKAGLTTIKLVQPDLDDADLTLTKEYPTRSFDLNSMVRYYDQFEQEWKGTEDNPLPKPEFSVRQVMGKSSNPEIDENGVLTVNGAGTYEISASVAGYSIAPIRIAITQEDWLDDIIMKEPSIDTNALNLKDVKTPVTIKNLKQYLEYYDQNGDYWEGKKPTVGFNIEGETDGAQIKGSNSDGYTFYAYEPGRYTVQPVANGYIINPIFIYVGEDQTLKIKTEDPPELKLEAGAEEASADIERCINYTTQFGGKWTGDQPALDFKLDSGVTGARIAKVTETDESTGDRVTKVMFTATKEGTYYIHVTPRKASEYADAIDDIVIDVVKDRRIRYVSLDFENIAMEDRIIGKDGTYTLTDLSKYLEYYDADYEEFTATDLKNYAYKLPEITGYTAALQSSETDAGEIIPVTTEEGETTSFNFTTGTSGIYILTPVVKGEEVTGMGESINVVPEGTDELFDELIEELFTTIEEEYGDDFESISQDVWEKFVKYIEDISTEIKEGKKEEAMQIKEQAIEELVAGSPLTRAAKEAAISELENYKNPADYRDAQKAELNSAVDAGKNNINLAKNREEVAGALDAAKAEIDKIKTDADLTAEELAEAKTKAKEELAAYKDESKYRDAQKAELSDAIKSGGEEIDAAADKDTVAAAAAKAKANMDKIKTDEELTAEEKAAEQAAKEEAEKKAKEEAEKKAKEEAEKKAAEEKAANAKGADGTAYGKGAGAKAVDKAITSRKSDADPKGAKIAPLLLQSKNQGKNSIKLTWKKVSGAKKYVVYGNACGKNNKMKKLATRAVNNMNVTKIAKKLKTKTYHKFMVVALDKDNKVVSTSAIIHVATKGNLKKAANPLKVVVKAKVNAKGKKIKKLKALIKTVVKKGKTVALKASFTKAKKSKVKKHVAIRFMSSNTKIATVSKKGVVKGIKKGTTIIYAYAQNGVYRSVKITVK